MSIDSNPYSPPTAISDQKIPVAIQPYLQRRSGWLLGLCVLHCVIMVGALAAQFVGIETILASGPIFAISGLVVTIFALVRRDVPIAIFAGTAPLFATFIFILINFMRWGPSDADQPVQALSFVYSLIALPIAIWLLVVRSASDEMGREGEL